MILNRTAVAVCVLAVLSGLTGCGKRDPRDIAKWKAAGNTRKLVAATRDDRQFMRLDAIEALGELKVNETLDPLVALFSDPDPVVVHAAIDAVAGMDDPRVEKHMLRALEFKTAPARRTAATTLGNLKSAAAVNPLIEALHDADESVAAAAATALGRIGDPRAAGPLSEKVEDRSFDIRIASVTSLSRLGGAAAARGLAAAMGDFSEAIRATAIEGLAGTGPDAVPLALNALRSESHFARESGAAVLEALDAVPTAGGDRVWYRIAQLTAGANPEVGRGRATGLARIDDGMETLVEALSHDQSEVRDYALLGLTEIGEPAAAAALAAAEQQAGPAAQAWLNGRTEWPGAPDWRLDLWGAAAALNPRFSLNRHIVSAMVPHTHSAEQMMKSTQFIPRCEYIPLLIIQLGKVDSKYRIRGSNPTLFGIQVLTDHAQEKIDVERVKRCRQLAAEHLVDAGYRSVQPLLAALNEPDPRLTAHAAETLVKICGERIDEPIAAALANRLEKGEDLSGTLLYQALLELDLPAVNPLLLKIRPD